MKLKDVSSKAGSQLYFDTAFKGRSLNVLGVKVIRQGKMSIRFGFKCIKSQHQRNESLLTKTCSLLFNPPTQKIFTENGKFVKDTLIPTYAGSTVHLKIDLATNSFCWFFDKVRFAKDYSLPECFENCQMVPFIMMYNQDDEIELL